MTTINEDMKALRYSIKRMSDDLHAGRLGAGSFAINGLGDLATQARNLQLKIAAQQVQTPTTSAMSRRDTVMLELLKLEVARRHALTLGNNEYSDPLEHWDDNEKRAARLELAQNCYEWADVILEASKS